MVGNVWCREPYLSSMYMGNRYVKTNEISKVGNINRLTRGCAKE